jgi:hypothetical protein
MKIFVPALDREGQAFVYLRNKISKLSKSKVKVEFFLDQTFEVLCRIWTKTALDDTEKAA